MTDVDLRAASPGDVDRLHEIARAAYQGYVADIGREPAPMVADFAALVDRGVVWVAAERSGAVVGFAVSYPTASGWHLENVAVDPVSHGMGIGARLIDDVERRAKDAGASAVELYTNEKMTANLTYYPRRGYAEIDRAEQDGFARVFFRKELS